MVWARVLANALLLSFQNLLKKFFLKEQFLPKTKRWLNIVLAALFVPFLGPEIKRS